MISIKETEIYTEVIKELNYSFADIFIFKGFVVSEIKQGVSFSWDEHAQTVVDDVFSFTGSKGGEIVLISNRINAYSILATDWLRYFKESYNLKAYCVISQKGNGIINTMIEKLFYPKKIRNFNTIFEAINFVKKGILEIS